MPWRHTENSLRRAFIMALIGATVLVLGVLMIGVSL